MVHNLAPQAIDCCTIDNLWLYTYSSIVRCATCRVGLLSHGKAGLSLAIWAWSSRIIEHT